MKITSQQDELEFIGDSVVIRRRGIANAMAAGINGDRSISVHSITAIQLRLAGWMAGYILFAYAGSKPFNGGLIEATQDPDSFIFRKAQNKEIEQFKAIVESRMKEIRAVSQKFTQNSTLLDDLKKLSEMKEQGILTQEEFELAKKKLLA